MSAPHRTSGMLLAPLVLVVLVVLALLAGCLPAPPESGPDEVTTPQAGGRLPDVRLESLGQGDPLDVGTLRGPAVVNLWATWCPPCREELPYYQAFAEEYDGRVRVIGVDFRERDPAGARELLRETGVQYENFTDPDGRLRAVALPQLVLLDEEGEIAFSQYLEIDGPDQLADLVEQHLGVGQETS